MMHGQGSARNGSAHGTGPPHSSGWDGPVVGPRGPVVPGGQPSCSSQTVPSGGAATVAENGWPCHDSSTASTPP
ncbi:hypothetical protein SAMN05660359_03029 [Geodermatophilus obscurus]|uniref:Uncharacterized protein n=1 Tax=Geodermatophilus obscurus TaxID=1861 RepID=A0A1I5GQG8_9ACTN|nr:hypothetical protein SAMN05660359_03029 [Geodermatophilus obscurus]